MSDRVIERFAYCLLPGAYCLLAVWARAGRDNYGHIVRNKGRGNVRKRGHFRGVWAGIGGSEGRMWGLESREKGAFLRTGGVDGGQIGVFWQHSDIMSAPAPGPTPPPGTMLRVRKLRVRTYESWPPPFRERARSRCSRCLDCWRKRALLWTRFPEF